jgi:hypothetical protein
MLKINIFLKNINQSVIKIYLKDDSNNKKTSYIIRLKNKAKNYIKFYSKVFLNKKYKKGV